VPIHQVPLAPSWNLGYAGETGPRREERRMDIGRPQRIIEIEPVSLPLPSPDLPAYEPVTEPAPDPNPVEPVDP